MKEEFIKLATKLQASFGDTIYDIQSKMQEMSGQLGEVSSRVQTIEDHQVNMYESIEKLQKESEELITYQDDVNRTTELGGQWESL